MGQGIVIGYQTVGFSLNPFSLFQPETRSLTVYVVKIILNRST
jgi:hypothetical protein